ncbi:MAG: hypothetical protein DRQ49_18920 [Gammaproteobacteria bacterium]|nr:MAG: hypothetical protein DRQ49_18920 [Gammaproteobacteria bacterium]
MHLKKLVPIVGFCAVSLFSNAAMAQLWSKNCATNQCLDATTGKTNGSVQVSDCDTSKKAQQWYANRGILPSSIENAYFKQQCLDMHKVVVGGFEVVTNKCDDNLKAQKWDFVPNGSDGQIGNAYFSGQCLTVAKDGTVTPAQCNGDDSQRWYWVNVGDKTPCALGESRMRIPRPRVSVRDSMADKANCSFNPPGVCSKDKNECGHPSVCECPVAYTYNPATGMCDYAFKQKQNVVNSENCECRCSEDNLACSDPAQGICTSDINECGNPSNCNCGINPAYKYNPATGQCDLTLD